MTAMRIQARSARAFAVRQGEFLVVTDPEGQQVADLVCFSESDPDEYLSSGRSIDYAGRIWLSTENILYSNRSTPMLRIVADDVGRHDFSLTPCSEDTFRILYDDHPCLPGCQGNLEAVMEPFGIPADRIPVPFNIFMNVAIDVRTGQFTVEPPLTQPGDQIIFEALEDLIVGLTACSAGQSNNFNCTPIDYEICRSAST